MSGTRPQIRCLVFSIFFIIIWLLSGCATDRGDRDTVNIPPSEHTLRVGVTLGLAPLIYQQGQDFVGLEAELAKEFGKFLDKSVRFIELDWTDQIPALLENRIDIIMSGMTITRLRQIRIAFSAPYLKTGQMALIRKGSGYLSPHGYFGILASAPFVKIGVIQGTTGEAFVKTRYSNAKEIFSYETPKEAVAALKLPETDLRRIDMFVIDLPIAYMLAAENEGELTWLPTLLTEEYLGWGIRKNDDDLLEKANRFIAGLKNDGTLDKIVRRWIPYSR